MARFSGVPIQAEEPLSPPAAKPSLGYGKRADGTEKGAGYFGELKRPDGDFSTEISVGVDYGSGEKEIPTLVPTLTEEEKNYLLEGNEPTRAIIDKAVQHARMRESKGLSPFAGPDDYKPSVQPAKSRFGGIPVGQDQNKPLPGEVPELDASGQVKDFPAPAATSPSLEERTRQLGRDYLGRGEALLSLVTGATGGTAGMVGGTIGGLLASIASGEFGTDAAADNIEQSATDAASGLTYTPRTAEGRETVQGIGETLAPLAALGPMTGELAAIGQGVKNAAPLVRGAIPERAPAASARPRVEPTVGDIGVAPVAAPQTVEGIAKSITDTTQASGKKQIPTMERLAAEVRPDETILQAAERLGIREQLIPSQYSRSQAYREIEQGLASIPGSQLNAQQKAAAASLAQKADDLIKEFGGDTDKAAVSAEFKSRGLDTIEGLAKKSDELYGKVSEAIPPTTKVNANNTVSALQQKAQELGGSNYLSAIERRVLNAATTDPTYARLDLIRKQVGEGMRGRGPFKDSEGGSLKRLYGALSDDQQSAADALGAGEMFSAAKQLVASRKAIEDDLAAVLGKDLSGALTSKTGNAIKRLGSGDYKDFDRIMQAIPEDQRQRVVMTSLNDALTSGSRMEKQLSAPGFVDWFEGLQRNRQAKNRLYTYMPKGSRGTLENIYRVARGMREANKERITTGRIQGLMENFANEGGMLSKLYGIGKQVAVAEGAGSAIGVPGAGTAGVIARVMSKEKTPVMKAADNLLSSQQFRSAITAYSQAAESPKKAAAIEKTLTASKPYRNWFNTLDKATQAAIKSNGALNWLSQQENNKEEASPSK